MRLIAILEDTPAMPDGIARFAGAAVRDTRSCLTLANETQAL